MEEDQSVLQSSCADVHCIIVSCLQDEGNCSQSRTVGGEDGGGVLHMEGFRGMAGLQAVIKQDFAVRQMLHLHLAY